MLKPSGPDNAPFVAYAQGQRLGKGADTRTWVVEQQCGAASNRGALLRFTYMVASLGDHFEVSRGSRSHFRNRVSGSLFFVRSLGCVKKRGQGFVDVVNVLILLFDTAV